MMPRHTLLLVLASALLSTCQSFSLRPPLLAGSLGPLPTLNLLPARILCADERHSIASLAGWA